MSMIEEFKENTQKKIKAGIIVSYLMSLASVIMGFYKMLVYYNPEIAIFMAKNAYVKGDAYNYIINACYTTAWFVLAGVFAVVGVAFVIAYYNMKSGTINKKE